MRLTGGRFVFQRLLIVNITTYCEECLKIFILAEFCSVTFDLLRLFISMCVDY